MDQIKIGKFIAEMRKEQNLTQIDLAEQLGISNKTISKWECGNGMPDYVVMESLCDILKINVNELLSGERLPSQEYNKKAEENIISLIQESSENYKREKREMILTIIGEIALLCLVELTIIMWGGGVGAISYFVDFPTTIYMLATTVLVLGVAGVLKDFISAFSIVLKRPASTDILRVKKSLQAVKTAIITVNVVGVLSFCIGLMASLTKMTSLESFWRWAFVAFLGIVYGLVITLVLIPIYTKLKNKLIEE